MANLKISQLPEYTGNTYNGYFVWNDSGETTTYKTKETNSYVKRLEIKDLIDTNTINPDVKSALIMGSNNTISSTSNSNYLIMGQDNTINAAVGNTPFAMVFGLGSSVSAFGGVCFGGYSSVGGERAFRWGNNGSSNGIESFSWGEQVNVNGTRSFGFGGYMTITPENSYSFGVANSITTSTPYQGIFGSESNLISSTGGNNFIFGSKASTISGTSQFVSLIGLSGFTSPTEDNTTYVDNFQVLGQAKYGNYNNGSQGTSYEIDWNNGNIQKVLLTGNTTFSATNITDGTTYILKVQQDAVGGRTATWTSSQFKFPNSTPPTLSTGANAVDILTFVAMDGVLYGVAQLNFG
jgi:hypothetical protein